MKNALCGANCAECPSKETCPGCAETKGCPFGKQCYVAKYILTNGMESYQAFKQGLIDEVNALHIDGMENVTELFPLVGSFVNLEYPVPSGTVKFLKDDEVYLGAQVKNLFDDSGKSCFGVIARENFILICTYGENGADPEIVTYKRRYIMSKYESLWNYLKNCNEDTLTLTFSEIGEIAGVPIDHSFLRYKKELAEYGWAVGKISMKEQKVLFQRKEE